MSAAEISDETLRKIPIFKNMHDSERRQLAEIATVKEFAQGDIILRQGKSSQNLWILLEGECEVIKEPEASQSGVKPVRLAYWPCIAILAKCRSSTQRRTPPPSGR